MGLTDIVVLVPVYQRPHRVIPLLRSFEKSRPNHAFVTFIASPEDSDQLDALEGTNHLVVPFPRARGDWARKINWGYRNTSEPWILCGADDIDFHPGWDRALRRAIRYGKRVLGTNDLNPNHNPENIYSPHPLVARSYVEQHGVVDKRGQVMCEQYHHNYPDRELAATAISRNEWQYVPDAILEHLHPGWTDTPPDHTYAIGAQHGIRDYNMYIRRHRLWIKERTLRERALKHAGHPR